MNPKLPALSTHEDQAMVTPVGNVAGLTQEAGAVADLELLPAVNYQELASEQESPKTSGLDVSLDMVPTGAPKVLYHGTSTKALESIREGMFLREQTDFGSAEVAEYYAEETAEADGSKPVVLAIPIERFKMAALKPDLNSIDEPLTYTLGTTEEEVWDQWKNSDRSWLACYDIVESVRYHAPLALEPSDFEDL